SCPSGLPRLWCCRFRLRWYPVYTPAVRRLSRLAMLQKVRSARLEMRGDHVALAELQILDFPVRRERHERKPAVDHHARVRSGGQDALRGSGETIERRGGRGLGRAAKERDIPRTETESHPSPWLGTLIALDSLRPRLENGEVPRRIEHSAIQNGLDADEARDVL